MALSRFWTFILSFGLALFILLVVSGCKNPNRFMKVTYAQYEADPSATTTIEDICRNMPFGSPLHYLGSNDTIDFLVAFTERYGKRAIVFRVNRPNSLVTERKNI